MIKHLKNKKGTTFIELLLYIAIFLVLTPVLLTVSINAARMDQQHNTEKQVNADSQFMVERIYDLISSAKKIDVAGTIFEDPAGKITLIMQDDSIVIIENNPITQKVEITEDGITSELSSEHAQVESLYFQRITDEVNDPEVILGVTVHLNITGVEEEGVVQEYITSANLEEGDFDGDECLDFIDKFPRHPECCGDADEDGTCDELDNCIMEYNPYQEDFDFDGVGDACDSSIFFEGGGEGDEGGGGLSAFNCSTDDQLIALLNQHPPLSSIQLKQIFIASSPLSPRVLKALIDHHENQNLIGHPHFEDIFIANVKLTNDVYQALIKMNNFPDPHMSKVVNAHLAAETIAWLGADQSNQIKYKTELSESFDKIKFYDADFPLGDEGAQNTDVFIIVAEGGSETVTVTTEASGIATNVLTGEGSNVTDALGFKVTLDGMVGSSYAFAVSSVSNTNPLDSVEFYFGENAVITYPTSNTYYTTRFINYCPGGCAVNCNDVGTGIISGDIFTDRCYRWDYTIPEWCALWKTFSDDNSVSPASPAFMGGNQAGEENLYWQKTFTSILSEAQTNELQSITVAAEIAYQRVSQFFCDTLSASCPMNGDLIGSQNVELYNWYTGSWEVIGEMGLSSTTSDQQIFEVIYDGDNPQRFVGGASNNIIAARIQFHWNGVPPEESESAPSFMLIDYFTLHLMW